MSLTRAERWALGLAAVDQLGTADLPLATIAPCGHKVGQWIATARKLHAQGKLTDERVADLNTRGMIWNQKEASFHSNLAELDRYIAEHGSPVVSAEHGALRAWVSRRRSEYMLGLLPDEHILALRERGVSFNPLRERWVAGLYALDRYLAQHGTTDGIGTHITDDGFKLGIWVAERRSEYRRGTLSPDKIRALNQRQIVWNPATEQRERAEQALTSYRLSHGHSRVPRNYRTQDGFPLGRWAPKLTAAISSPTPDIQAVAA